MIRIALDAFGGIAPRAVVEGALDALRDYDDIAIVLCGRRTPSAPSSGKNTTKAAL